MAIQAMAKNPGVTKSDCSQAEMEGMIKKAIEDGNKYLGEEKTTAIVNGLKQMQATVKDVTDAKNTAQQLYEDPAGSLATMAFKVGNDALAKKLDMFDLTVK